MDIVRIGKYRVRSALVNSPSEHHHLIMVYFDSEHLSFHLRTEDSSYLMAVTKTGHLLNLYYGKKLAAEHPYVNLMPVVVMPYPNQTSYATQQSAAGESDFVQETSRLEYSHPGKGDYRDPSCIIFSQNGDSSFDFVYESHRLLDEKPALEGLPSATTTPLGNTRDSSARRDTPGESNTAARHPKPLPHTLEITLKDSVHDVRLILSYTTLDDCNLICRDARLENDSEFPLSLNKFMSASVDLEIPSWELITLDGAWSRERHVSRHPISPGKHEVCSRKGVSSSDHSPFIALSEPHTTQNAGEAIGIALVYSGNHSSSVELSPHGITRLQIGINPERFQWHLAPGTSFQSPEALLSFSNEGLNGLSHNFHQVINHHIIPERRRNSERPVLVNNWEATYFDFDEKKLISLAKEAAGLGVELFVLDDGWFGKRNDDTSSLGDWFINRKKLPGGLKKLADKIRGTGMAFGIWVEPEMISIDSELYRAHPDWMVRTPGRSPSPARNQYLLDITNTQVRDYLYSTLSSVFAEAGVSYVKWDMNRNFSDIFSPTLSPERQFEFDHRYVLGLYDLLTRITTTFPDVLFEACAAGGNRFDIGMLAYMPQIWTSDNSDAAERLDIQTGSSYFSPLSTMGAHVSDVPNHQTLRNTPIETRFNVAAFGVLGYELDLTKLSAFERQVIKKQIDFYKQHRQVLQFGRFYRLEHPEAPNGFAWMVVSDDQSQAVLGIYQKLSSANPPSMRVRLAGLDAQGVYDVEARTQYIDLHSLGNLVSRALPVKLDANGKLFDIVANHHLFAAESFRIQAGGDQLMSAGLRPPQRFHGGGYDKNLALTGDFASRLYTLKRTNSTAGRPTGN